MTTKTIPAYLEDERKKSKDDLLRMEAEQTLIVSGPRPAYDSEIVVAPVERVESTSNLPT